MTLSEKPQADARDVFGQRAGYYTTSATHADADTLGQLLTLANPQRMTSASISAPAPATPPWH